MTSHETLALSAALRRFDRLARPTARKYRRVSRLRSRLGRLLRSRP